AEEAPKPAPKKRAPRKKTPKAEEAQAAALEIDFPGEKPAEAAPKPKRTRTAKPKAPKPAVDDRDEVIDLDLFSGGVS
ncbi:MAG: hypothetical protein IJS70_00745, partial [Bacteroidales bacterium]|nr:hypothetical protein [Bacteroidales bacterium]